MRLVVVSTSWPSLLRPWAGHFVADLSAAIAATGVEVRALVPQFGAGGALQTRPGVALLPARVRGAPRSPARDPRFGLEMLRALRRRAAGEGADLWLCHWWPTGLAAPPGARRLLVLHGSDVDLMERLPGAAVRALTRGTSVVAVADALGRRFAAHTGAAAPEICPLGASAHGDSLDGDGAPPDFARAFVDASGPRVLTVGRDAPGKGLGVVREAAGRLPGVSWLVLTPELGAGPRDVERLVACADLVVVPSEDGPGMPREGSPHIIAQALVAGVPVLAGPNRAVREAARRLGQAEVAEPGAEALADAVIWCLNRENHVKLASEARLRGAERGWERVLPAWLSAMERASQGTRQPSPRT